MEDKRLLLQSSYNEWVVGGYKNEVEAMSAYIDQVTKQSIGDANLEGERILL